MQCHLQLINLIGQKLTQTMNWTKFTNTMIWTKYTKTIDWTETYGMKSIAAVSMKLAVTRERTMMMAPRMAVNANPIL